MLDDALLVLNELRDRVISEQNEKERAANARGGRQSTLDESAPRAQSQAGPSWSKQTIYSAHRGEVQRPSFSPARLSPRLNPAVGGSGSKSSHAIVCGASPQLRPSPEL